MIRIFSKPGCGKCEAAKEKCERLGVAFTVCSLEHAVTWHEEWRTDGSVEVLAAHSMLSTLPLIEIDGTFHDYPSAMRELKKRRGANGQGR